MSFGSLEKCERQLKTCKTEEEKVKLLMANLDLYFARYGRGRAPAAPDCDCQRYKLVNNGLHWTCTNCKRVVSYQTHVDRLKPIGFYRCIHYCHTLLRYYTSSETPPPDHIIRRFMQIWDDAGRPKVTQYMFQKLTDTKNDPTFRPYIKNWRIFARRTRSQKIPHLSKREYRAIHDIFLALNLAFKAVGGYKERKSFLNYPFIFRRIMDLQGMGHVHNEYLPGLKGKSKFLYHYRIYVKLARYCGLPIILSKY